MTNITTLHQLQWYHVSCTLFDTYVPQLATALPSDTHVSKNRSPLLHTNCVINAPKLECVETRMNHCTTSDVVGKALYRHRPNTACTTSTSGCWNPGCWIIAACKQWCVTKKHICCHLFSVQYIKSNYTLPWAGSRPLSPPRRYTQSLSMQIYRVLQIIEQDITNNRHCCDKM